MLFDPAAYEKITAQAKRLDDAREGSGNRWHKAWDDRANAIHTAYAEAVQKDTPVHWRQICDLAVKLRVEMPKEDGHETS